MSQYPEEYLQVLLIAKELGADIGDREILLKNNAGENIVNPQHNDSTQTNQKNGAGYK